MIFTLFLTVRHAYDRNISFLLCILPLHCRSLSRHLLRRLGGGSGRRHAAPVPPAARRIGERNPQRHLSRGRLHLFPSQCPFLNKEKLCRLILALGEDSLSVTCREHPRFWEEYGNTRETCLSISCPEAARLLLEEPLELCVQETDESAPEDPELNPAFFRQLLIYRRALFALSRSHRSLADRLSLALDAAENGITLPEDDEIPPDFWDSLPAPPLQLSLTDYFAAMESMEFTRPQLKELLPRVIASGAPLPLADSEAADAGGRILFYFLYRYVLRGVWSGLVAEKVRFAVYSTAAILALSQHMDAPSAHLQILDAAVLYSREVEHSPENLELLYEHLCSSD